jgi:hypothetical protein
VFKKPAFLSELNNNYEYFIPYTMKLKKKSAKSREVALKIKEFYFGDKPVSRETLQPLFDVSNINVYVLYTMSSSSSSSPSSPLSYVY